MFWTPQQQPLRADASRDFYFVLTQGSRSRRDYPPAILRDLILCSAFKKIQYLSM